MASLFDAAHGIPLVSSGCAIIWACLQAAGVRERLPSMGRLLAEQPMLSWKYLLKETPAPFTEKASLRVVAEVNSTLWQAATERRHRRRCTEKAKNAVRTDTPS